jgi:putative transcriptional regulator
MKLLRDKSFSTQILILYELYTKPYSKLTSIAEKIGVTQQAVSEYMKSMIKQDLVQKIDGEYKPTIKGTYILQNELSDLKRFVDERMDKLSLIKNCVALAKTPVKPGEKVGLFMDDGWLVAYANKQSSSVGIANNMANAGEYITLGNLDGIIDHKIGKLSYFELPSPFTSKQKKIDTESIKKRLQTMNIDRVGVLDVVAKSICKKIGIKPDFEFGVIYAAIDAAQRGLNTAIFGYDEKIRETLKIFEEINEKSNEKINYELFSTK